MRLFTLSSDFDAMAVPVIVVGIVRMRGAS